MTNVCENFYKPKYLSFSMAILVCLEGNVRNMHINNFYFLFSRIIWYGNCAIQVTSMCHAIFT